MNPDPPEQIDPILEKQIELTEECCYNLLTSTDRSEDYAVNYLRMLIKQKGATSREIRKISNYYAKIFVRKSQVLIDNPPENEELVVEGITKESLDETMEAYENGLI